MKTLSPQVPVPPKDSDHVESLERGLAVLRALDGRNRPLSVTELAECVGITRTAARRFALTLEHLGYLGQEAAGYSLRPRVLEIGDAYLRSHALPALAHPHLAALVREVGESASLTVLHDRRVVYIDRVAAERVVTANIVVGGSVPAHATATGRVLLAALSPEQFEEHLHWLAATQGEGAAPVDLDKTRAQVLDAAHRGWALADQELTPGIISIAVPVHGPSGEVVAALNVAAHSSRVHRDTFEGHVLALLREAADTIEAELRSAGPVAPAPAGPEHEEGVPGHQRDASAGRGPEVPRPKDAVQSLERGLAILRSFNEEHPTMNLTEVSERCGLPRSVARRFLRTLLSLGYVRANGRRFETTPEVLALGYSHLATLSLADVVKPHIEALSRSLNATVSVGVLDGLDVRYVGRVSAPSPLAVSIRVGTRVPAHRTAMGRVLMASLPEGQLALHLAATEDALDANRLDASARRELGTALEQVRTQGWSYVDQLLDVGVRAIAVPLRNRRNEIVAALSASVHDADTSEEEMVRDFLPRVIDAAAAMTYEFRPGIEA